MKHLKLYLILTALVILVSCQKRKCGFDETHYLQGNWEWVKTYGGLAGITETPASTGNTMLLELASGGNFTITKNSVITEQGNYNTDTQFCYHRNYTRSALKLGNAMLLTIERNDADTLILAEEYADGLTHIYTRK